MQAAPDTDHTIQTSLLAQSLDKPAGGNHGADSM